MASGAGPDPAAAGPVPGPGSARRHDLDALRGFAMLLGVGLHASLAFFPSFWPAQDSTSDLNGPFDEFLWAVHGFRMPVFFLLSGFFTAMLWRRRGLGRLMWHRVRRIALPLAAGMATIVPLTDWVSERAVDRTAGLAAVEQGDLRGAVFAGKAGAVAELLDRGVDPTGRPEWDPRGWTPLHAAVAGDSVEIIELLLDRGADPAARTVELGDGGEVVNTYTALDLAVWYGRAEAADALVAGGAADVRGPGQEWSDLWWWRAGAPDVEEGEDDEFALPGWLSSFHHLWFLWFLCWMVAGFAAVAGASELLARRRSAGAVRRAAADAGDGAVESDEDMPAGDEAGDGALGSAALGSAGSAIRWRRWWPWLLVPVTVIPQLAMGGGGDFPVFGPDTATGFWPPAHVLAYYGLFFAFGALIYDRRNRSGDRLLIDAVGRHWFAWLPVTAVVILPLGLGLTFAEDGSWPLASVAQVAYTWAMCFALIGLFRKALPAERRSVRYLSDASYWIYLAHLPLVIELQALTRDWDLPPTVKFTGLCLAVTALLLAVYQTGVRHTPIGWLLNGRRRSPGSSSPRVRLPVR